MYFLVFYFHIRTNYECKNDSNYFNMHPLGMIKIKEWVYMNNNKKSTNKKYNYEVSNEIGLTSNGRREPKSKDKSVVDGMVQSFKNNIDDKR